MRMDIDYDKGKPNIVCDAFSYPNIVVTKGTAEQLGPSIKRGHYCFIMNRSPLVELRSGAASAFIDVTGDTNF